MTRTEKNKILIVVLYFVCFLIFDLVSEIIMLDGDLNQMVGGNYNFFKILGLYAKNGLYYFIFISCIAIYIKFSKKINIEYKNIIRWLPLCTFILALPMCTINAILVRIYLYII